MIGSAASRGYRGWGLLLAGLLILGVTSFSSLAAAEEEKERPAMTGFSEQITFFYYKDLDQAAGFYGGVLGLKLKLDLGWAKLYSVTDSATVGLVLEGKGFHRALDGEKPVMLSLVVEDVEAWFRKLEASGVPILRPLTEEAAEKRENRAPVRSFLVSDPGGYSVEIFAWRK